MLIHKNHQQKIYFVVTLQIIMLIQVDPDQWFALLVYLYWLHLDAPVIWVVVPVSNVIELVNISSIVTFCMYLKHDSFNGIIKMFSYTCFLFWKCCEELNGILFQKVLYQQIHETCSFSDGIMIGPSFCFLK